MKQEIYLYFIGTAGSGKSTLTSVFKNWMTQRGLDSIIVNLDPGADNLPYQPDVDIRDWISLEEVMESNNLGPNGAQIACADMLALNTEDVKESIDSFKTDYVLMDTPGQLELFVFREAGKYIIKFFNPEKTMIAYLIDPALAKTPSGFTSQLLLSINTNFRMKTPQVNLLSKADILNKEERQQIRNWASNPDLLYESVAQEEPSTHREMNEKITRLIESFGTQAKLIPTSKEQFLGMEDLYTRVQFQFHAGEDLTSD